MQQFLFRRVSLALLALFALSILTFSLLHTERSKALLSHANIIEACPGACYVPEDPPLHLQYAHYMKYTFQGDWDKAWRLGSSFREYWDEGFGNAALKRIPATLQLVSLSLLLSTVLGIALGVFSAINRHSPLFRWTDVVVSFGQSMPIFWLGVMLLGAFSIQFNWFPVGSGEGFAHMILPAITLAWLPAMLLAKLIRAAMSSVLESNYVNLARIKGLSEWKVIWKHCLRNVAVSPIISFSLIGGAFMTSLILTEAIFNWPGAGISTLQSIGANGYHPTLSGLVLFLGGGFILCHLGFDLLRAFLDPRIRFSATTSLDT